MSILPFRLRRLALSLALALAATSGAAQADPPSRVARLGYLAGDVSFSPAGEPEWVGASLNRPLTPGDRIWTAAGARAELQVGGATARVDADTGLSLLNLDDRTTQLQLTQGVVNLRVRRLDADQVFEIDTPNLAFTLLAPGNYRVEVDADGTTIVVHRGKGQVYGEGAAAVIDARQPWRYTGTGLEGAEAIAPPRADDFDRWSSERERAVEASVSARYVSPDVVGYQDLDANGSWHVDPEYGNVWVPSHVAADWAPYRDGHWAWVDPWGWTWVDDAPWGYAVSHYGRWAHVQGEWGWVPGPVTTHAYYAPALVAFVGGATLRLSAGGGGVAWFPLAPREVYRPSYQASRGYYENVNRSNTVVNTTVINNSYNQTTVNNIVYANRQVPGAVIAVPAATFAQSRPVAHAALPVSRETAAGGPVEVAPAVAPTARSVQGGAAAEAAGKPPPRGFERPVVAHTAPPPAHAGFAAQQQQLAATPGRPLDEAARHALKPAVSAPAPVLKIVGPATAPAVAPASRALPAVPTEAPGKAGERPQRAPDSPANPPTRPQPLPQAPSQLPPQSPQPAPTPAAPPKPGAPPPSSAARSPAPRTDRPPADPMPAPQPTQAAHPPQPPQAVPPAARPPAVEPRPPQQQVQPLPQVRPQAQPQAQPQQRQQPQPQPQPHAPAAAAPPRVANEPHEAPPKPAAGAPNEPKKEPSKDEEHKPKP